MIFFYLKALYSPVERQLLHKYSLLVEKYADIRSEYQI